MHLCTIRLDFACWLCSSLPGSNSAEIVACLGKAMQRQQLAAAMLLRVAQVCVTPTVLLGPSCLRPSQQHVAVTSFKM